MRLRCDMNKIEKIALKKLETKKQDFKNEKYEVLTNLLKNNSYKTLYKQHQSAMITFTKNPSQENKKDLQQKQKLLLKLQTALNENSQVLTKEYMCNLCKDSGFIDDTACTCLNQIISKMLMEDSGISFETLNNINNDFSIFTNPDKIEKKYNTLEKWCDNFKNSQIKNWGFFGHAGTGKTHLMLHTLKILIEKGYFVHFTTAFNMAQNLLLQHTNFEEKNRDYLSKYLECDVLFIDDMGTEPRYKNVSENYLYSILNQRMIENKSVIFSSNFDISQFEDFYGERIFSRLINKRTSKSLWFDGQDLRLKK